MMLHKKYKHQKLKQVIKQKCKFLGNTNPREYSLAQIRAEVHSKYLLHITNTTIETTNEITLLEELKPLFLYLCSCVLYEELHNNWDQLHIKIQFYRTTLGCNDNIIFSLNELKENPLKVIERKISIVKSDDFYMGFLKPFRLEIFLPSMGTPRNVIHNNVCAAKENVREHNTNAYKEDVCVVCMTNKPDILFCNCGHLIVCGVCYIGIKNGKCPKCRKENDIIRKI